MFAIRQYTSIIVYTSLVAPKILISVHKHYKVTFISLKQQLKSFSLFKVAILEQLKDLHSVNVALSCDQRKLIVSSTPFPGEIPGY